MNVSSGLGEALKLEIELETADAAETNSLSVRLASPDMFKSAGLDYPYGLPQLKFLIEKREASGLPFLKITSVQPINEPFVSLLVELNWSSGKLLREYTFLLDPPGYRVELPQVAEVKPVEPGVITGTWAAPARGGVENTALAESGVTPPDETLAMVGEDTAAAQSSGGEEVSELLASEEPAQAGLISEQMSPAGGVPEEASVPVAKETTGKVLATGVIKVKRGDTLIQLARQLAPADISLERMLVALYRANNEAFDGKNMNRLQAGKILRLPDQFELDQVGQAQAVKVIHTQVADWNAYRQKLAAVKVDVAEQTPRQEVSGKISASVVDQAPPAKALAKEVVRLSKGEAPGDKAATGGNEKSLQDKIHAQEEEAIARNKALQESNERIAMLEKIIKDKQRLIEMKEQSASRPEAKGATAKVEMLPKAPIVSAIPASAVAAASAVQPAKPAQKPEMLISEPSLVEAILEEPLYLAGGAAALLALGGLGFMMKRRGKSGKKKVDDRESGDTDAIAGRILEPAAPSPATGDFTGQFVAAPVAGNTPDDVDPISEADLFLNFGRDEQAEEILKDALQKTPANHQIHLKLLSIYLNRREVNAFAAVAQQLKDSGDSAAWEKAAAMGLKLEPNNPMYGGVAAVPVSTPTPRATPEVMFDVGAAKEQTSTLDFDISLVAASAAAPSTEPEMDSTVVLNAPMDFDVTGSRPVTPAQEIAAAPAPAMNLDDLIFDVTASHEVVPEVAKEAGAAVSESGTTKEDEGLAFTLDFPGISQPAPFPENTPSKPAMDMGLTEISLNLDEPAVPAPTPATSAGGKDEHWQDVATKLDLANAYQEMGDTAGAREILEEVLRDGDDQQRAAAEAMLKQMG